MRLDDVADSRRLHGTDSDRLCVIAFCLCHSCRGADGLCKGFGLCLRDCGGVGCLGAAGWVCGAALGGIEGDGAALGVYGNDLRDCAGNVLGACG